MRRKRTLFLAKAATILSVVPVLIYAYAEGPPPKKTGVPGEGLCTDCHLGTANSANGDVRVTFPGALTYTPGVKQRLTVTVDDSSAVIYGFQLTVRVDNDLTQQAGSLDPVDASTQVICGDGSPKPAGQDCPASAPLQFIEHKLASSQSTFQVDWTPPATNVGDIKVYVAGNGANGNGNNTGDHIFTEDYKLTAPVSVNKPVINAGGVINAWNGQPTISNGAWISIFGSNLASTTRTWRSDEIINGQLPTELDNVKVRIGGEDAFVYFISPGQINVQAPTDSSVGSLSVTVQNNNGLSDPVTVTKQAVSPALFTWSGVVAGGEKYAGALFSDFGYAGKAGLLQPVSITTRPAKPGEFLLLFGTGFGATNPAVPAGQVVTSPVPTSSNVTATIGGIPAEVATGAGYLIFAGEYQFNVKIPDAVPDGDNLVELEVNGAKTQGNIFITIQR